MCASSWLAVSFLVYAPVICYLWSVWVQEEYATLQSTLRHIVRTEGLGSLFAGIAPRAFRIAGAVIILQSVRNSLISLVEGMKADHAALEDVPLVPLPSE